MLTKVLESMILECLHDGKGVPHPQTVHQKKVSGAEAIFSALECGVLQGSILLPVLFLQVMDPLIRGMECDNLGPSVTGTYTGSYAHSDEIHTVTSSLPCFNDKSTWCHRGRSRTESI